MIKLHEIPVYDRLESTIINHIFPHLGKMKIDKVTRNHVQGLINKLHSEKKLSYSSVKKVYVALKSCYKNALIDGFVIRNPCDGISLPSPKERTFRRFADEWVKSEGGMLNIFLGEKRKNANFCLRIEL